MTRKNSFDELAEWDLLPSGFSLTVLGSGIEEG
jgi:hypothetical protein